MRSIELTTNNSALDSGQNMAVGSQVTVKKIELRETYLKTTKTQGKLREIKIQNCFEPCKPFNFPMSRKEILKDLVVKNFLSPYSVSNASSQLNRIYEK